MAYIEMQLFVLNVSKFYSTEFINICGPSVLAIWHLVFKNKQQLQPPMLWIAENCNST